MLPPIGITSDSTYPPKADHEVHIPQIQYVDEFVDVPVARHRRESGSDRRNWGWVKTLVPGWYLK